MNSRTTTRALSLAFCFALIAGACGSSDTSTETETDATEAQDDTATSESSDTTVAEADATEDTGTEDTGTESDTADAGDESSLRSEVITSANWGGNVTISVDGTTASFTSDGLPDHEYLDAYLADGQDGFYIAGGVDSYDASYSFPIVPTVADSSVDTSNGAIGVAVSGAVFFNPYEGDGSDTVANDDNTTIDGVPFIDACGGHPLPNAIEYHYHGIPFCITDALDTDGEHSEIVGFLFDGYPIYGPQDVGGEEATDLDECMGHTGPTPDFEEDTYHYHVSSTANYISECFHGEVTVTTGGGGGGGGGGGRP